MFALSMPLDASAQYTWIHIHVQQVLFIQWSYLPSSSALFPNKCYKCNTLIAAASGEPAVAASHLFLNTIHQSCLQLNVHSETQNMSTSVVCVVIAVMKWGSWIHNHCCWLMQLKPLTYAAWMDLFTYVCEKEWLTPTAANSVNLIFIHVAGLKKTARHRKTLAAWCIKMALKCGITSY